jgi:hypothetical protein
LKNRVFKEPVTIRSYYDPKADEGSTAPTEAEPPQSAAR